MADPLAEKVMQPAVNPDHLSYCPTMDLVALATIDEQVHVNRLNGQKVFGVSNKRAPSGVKHIKWKPNGQSLAVAFSDQTLCLTNSHTGKSVHQIDCSAYSDSQICCLGWGVAFTNSATLGTQLEKLRDQVTLEDLISHDPQTKPQETLSDLPRDLAFLDVEALLPKPSTLSSGGIEDDIFSSRASLDTFLQPLNTGSTDSADILIVGFEDGTVHLSIYDFFDVGTFSLQQCLPALQDCRPLLHCSHPLSTTHTLLVASSDKGEEKMYILPLDLRLVSNTGRYLSLLASKSAQLHNILRYIVQVQKQMYSDFKASQDLPSRFIGNIEETLQEQRDCNWSQAAYHLVVTGNCYPEIREWLVDQVGERGHKRWEKATVTGYESVRRLAHESLLPALERFGVLASRLRGLSKFQVSSTSLGLSTLELDNILDTSNCLQLLTHHILIASASELRQFLAFSGWLRQEIENQSTDRSTLEAAEKDTNVDHSSALEYIQRAMMHSQLYDYFDVQAQADQNPQVDLAAEGGSLFGLYKRELQNSSNDGSSVMRLPRLDAIIKHLDTQCKRAFNAIAETQKRNVRFGAPIYVGDGNGKCKDMRILVKDPEEKDNFVLYVALGNGSEDGHVRIYRIAMDIANGMSSTTGVERAIIQTEGQKLEDIKFVDDDELMLAVVDDSSARLLRVWYRKKIDGSGPLTYAKIHSDSESTAEYTSSSVMDISDTEKENEYTWLKFPEGISSMPRVMEVNGRKGRRAICVLAQDNFHYRIYDLDAHSRGQEHEGFRTEQRDENMP